MNITIKTLSALTIATAALAATVIPSSAGGSFTIGGSNAPTQQQPPPPPAKPSKLAGALAQHGPFKCLVCNLPQQSYPHPVGPRPDPDRDHGDREDHEDYRDHGEHGWNHWHYGHGGPVIYVEGPPEATVVAAPVSPVRVSAPAPRYPVRVSAPQPDASPGNCLTKQGLPDGSVLFQDICTKESALLPPPQSVGAR
jgi:hypothetical protein